jgi:hypothetical protein
LELHEFVRAGSAALASLAPVFNLKTRHARHVIGVRGDQLGTTRESMSRDRCIEVLDSGLDLLS